MSNKVNLDELRENARTNYGITNADDLDAETLQTEIDAIDKQAEDAKDEEAKVQHNADRAGANSTTNPASGASDGNASTDGDEGDEGDEGKEEETPKDLSKLGRTDLEARAREAGVDGDPSDKEQYPNKDALVTAIETARSAQ